MNALGFVQRQIAHIRRGGKAVLARKAGKAFRLLLSLPFYVLAVPAALVIRAVRPWILIRLGSMPVGSIGHFAGDTELYLCERDAGINQPSQRHVDLFFMHNLVCNQQLAKMWQRVLRVWPNWILAPLYHVDRLMPGAAIPNCCITTEEDRDAYNLLDRFPPHLEFTPEEEARGEAGLRAMGIAQGSRFVCLHVRDNAWNAYCEGVDIWSSEVSYRDSDVQDYILAAETLADRGYVVIRMGAVVREAMKTAHPGVIDYATNGMRSDFMDIYLGAKCEFCIAVGSGFDGVPMIFRRPIAFVNFVALGELLTSSARFLSITKHHRLAAEDRNLSLDEIFSRGAGFLYESEDYAAAGIRLVENSPEEIRDLAVEMAERLQDDWRPQEGDEALQERFWKIFMKYAPGIERGRPWHGEIRARFGAVFLRANLAWLDH